MASDRMGGLPTAGGGAEDHEELKEDQVELKEDQVELQELEGEQVGSRRSGG